MIRTNIYGDRRLKYVSVTLGGYTLNYGFLTPVDDSIGSILGHQTFTDTPPTNFTVGANSPRPAKASNRGITSYVSSSRIVTARGQGWRIIKPVQIKATPIYSSAPGIVPDNGSVAVFVEIRGIFYSWRMPNFQYNFFTSGQRSTLGIKLPTTEAETKRMVYGASFPKPGRATKITANINNTIIQRVTTYYSENADLGTQFIIVAQPKVLLSR